MNEPYEMHPKFSEGKMDDDWPSCEGFVMMLAGAFIFSLGLGLGWWLWG